MSDVRVPHRCARGDRCSHRVRVEHDPGCPCQCHGQSALDAVCDIEGGCGSTQDPTAPPVFEGGPILSVVGLCEGCTTRVDRALPELPLDYTELNLLLASGQTGIVSDVVMGSQELQVPMRVSIEALQATMLHEVQAWAEPLAELLGIAWDTAGARHSRRGWVLQRAVRLLSGALPKFLALPRQEYRYARDAEWIVRDGIDGACELVRIHEMVRFASGKTKLTHQLPSPCPRCEHMTLVRHNGTEHVTCETCGVRWPEQDYRRLVLILAEDYQDVELVHRERVRLVSCEQGTVGSAAGGFYPSWPNPPMVEFPESVSA